MRNEWLTSVECAVIKTSPISVTPSMSYSMNDDLKATLEYEASALRMVDGKISGRQWGNNGELALNLAYSAF